jgi:hypothetical protein
LVIRQYFRKRFMYRLASLGLSRRVPLLDRRFQPHLNQTLYVPIDDSPRHALHPRRVQNGVRRRQLSQSAPAALAVVDTFSREAPSFNHSSRPAVSICSKVSPSTPGAPGWAFASS